VRPRHCRAQTLHIRNDSQNLLAGLQRELARLKTLLGPSLRLIRQFTPPLGYFNQTGVLISIRDELGQLHTVSCACTRAKGAADMFRHDR
jgi:hypothetical protein